MRPRLLKVNVLQTMIFLCVVFNYLNIHAEQNDTVDFDKQTRTTRLKPPIQAPNAELTGECNFEVVLNNNKIDFSWDIECFPNSYYITFDVQEKNYTTTNRELSFTITDVNYSDFFIIQVYIRGSNDPHELYYELTNSVDIEKPAGQVSKVYLSYEIGKDVNYFITASDNKELSELQFEVYNQSDQKLYEKSWSANGIYATRSSSFSTSEWMPGKYNYALSVTDASNNTQNYSGSFQLIDSVKPTGKIDNLKSTYDYGENINCILSAQDETSLKTISFSITDYHHQSIYEKIWNINKNVDNITTSIQTTSWNEGQYYCMLIVEDTSGNKTTYYDSFKLEFTPPIKPSPPTAYSTSPTSIKITWNGLSNVSSFSLWREVNGFLQRMYCGTKTYYYDNDNILPNNTYTYKIKTADSNTACYSQAIWSSLSDAFSLKTIEAEDYTKPTGKITIEPNIINQNGTILYAIEAQDNNKLSEINLLITDNSGLTKYDSTVSISESNYDKKESIDTRDWGAGLFHYTLTIIDSSKNESHYSDSFEIVARPISYEIKENTKTLTGSNLAIPITLNNQTDCLIKGIDIELIYDSNVLLATSATLMGGVLEEFNYSIFFNTNIEGKVLISIIPSSNIFSGEGIIVNVNFYVVGKTGDTTELTITSITNEIENIANKGWVEIIDNSPVISFSKNIKIVDCHTEETVLNASLLHNDQYQSYSNNDGSFDLIAQQSETYTIAIIAEGYLPYTGTIDFLKGANKKTDICIRPIVKKAIIIVGANETYNNYDAYTSCAHEANTHLGTLCGYECKMFDSTTPIVASAESFKNAIIGGWAKEADELILYMVGHGSKEEFLIGNDKVAPNIIKGYLDDLQQTMKGKLIIIYDACNSGSFIKKLIPPIGKQRIIITSTSSDEPAVFANNGTKSFSHRFWSCHPLKQNQSLKKAIDNTRDDLAGEGLNEPHFDANGNGDKDEDEDKAILDTIFIKTKPLNENSLKRYAYRTNTIDETVLTGNSSYLISARLTNDMKDIKQVIAIITSSDYYTGSANNPVTNAKKVLLEQLDNESFATLYNSFSLEGKYYIDIFAVNSESVFTFIKRTTVIQKGVPDTNEDDDNLFLSNIEPDEYEPDDHILSSDMIDRPQRHNFHQQEDTDWGMFYCNNDLEYTIKVINSGKECNAVIELYTISSQDSLLSLDNTGKGENEILTCICPETGFYYVKVSNSNPGIYGIDTEYTLIIENSGNTDAYEDDDNLESASIFIPGELGSQYHNIHDMGDQDWVTFNGIKDKRYTIRVIDVGARLDAVLNFMDSSGNIIGESRNLSHEGEEEEIFANPLEKSGTYYVSVSNADVNIFGKNTHYSLEIFIPESPPFAVIRGDVKDAITGKVIPTMQTYIDDNVILSYSYGGGHFLYITDGPGTYLLSIKDCNYMNYSSPIVLKSSEVVDMYIKLEPAPFYQCFKLTDAIIALQILADFKNQVHMDYFMNDPVNLSDVILILSHISDEENQE